MANSKPQSSEPSLRDMDEATLLVHLQKHSKFKSRSSTTHDTDHLPILAQSSQPITLLFLGDSMFERFKTTGSHIPHFGPSSPSFLPHPLFFNAGVGGDKISNIIYRLAEKNLYTTLQQNGGVEYVFLEMGTNDLAADKKALQQTHVYEYKLIIEALRRINHRSGKKVKICVCGINPRMKSRMKKDGIVEESNEMLKAMVAELITSYNDHDDDNTSDGVALAVEYLEPDPRLWDVDTYLDDDGLHLNEEGYEIFGESLWRKYVEMRGYYENI